MRSNAKRLCVAGLSILLLSQSSCISSRKLTVGAAAMLLEDVAKSSYRQSDLRIIREGMPSYLMLLDGMVQAWPDNERLLISASQGYSSFASAVADEEDVEYQKLLFSMAKKYAFKALALRGMEHPDIMPFDDFEKAVKKMGKKDMPYVFWTAACWGNWISVNLNSMEAMAELPRVKLLMDKALELDEGYYYGSPHLFMGIWFASRPPVAGGNPEKAKRHFMKAMELGEDKFLMAHVYYAEYYARKTFDKDLFVSTLKKVMKAPVDISPDITLINAVAKKRAEKLLKRADEYFE